MTVKIKPWAHVVLILAIFLSFYLAMRLFNLTKLPIFTDEAIYIRWSQIGSWDANWRFISLTDGKQPLFTWILMVLLRLIPDPLFAGRFVSVLAGAASLIGIWLTSYELFRNKKAAYLGSLVYLLCPFTLMYDRMALYDSLTASIFIWSLYLSVLLIRTVRLDIALLLGSVLGLGMLNKSIGFLSLYLLPLTILIIETPQVNKKKYIVRWAVLAVIAALVSQVLYLVLRLSPFFHIIAMKDTVFVYPFIEWATHPFRFFIGNIKGLFDWTWHYVTLPIFVISAIPLFWFGKDSPKRLFLYLYWFLPFVALALFGKVLYPRFILFMTMPLLILVGLGLSKLVGYLRLSIFSLAIYAIIIFPSLYTDYYILTNPEFAPIPYSDRGQLIEDWPAGGGIKEVNQYLTDQAEKGKVSVFTEGTFGLLPYAIEIYLVNNPNVDIHGIWPLPTHMPQEIVNSSRDHPTYFILNQTQVAPSGWPLELIVAYQKGTRENRKLRLYQVVFEAPKKI